MELFLEKSVERSIKGSIPIKVTVTFCKMFAILTAFILDLIIGDPVYPYHPVRMMGRIIERTEGFLRRKFSDQRLAGTILALGLPVGVYAVVSFILWWVGEIHFVLAWVMSVLGIYAAVSVKDLKKEAMAVYEAMDQEDLPRARSNLSRIVGRETQHLKEKDIIRASVETVAESTVDGIISPLFYAALGGAPLALAYKAINTLDSMIGHNNERYRNFGYTAARLDDLANWIPARLSFILIALASFFITRNIKQTLTSGWRFGIRAPFGNSAIPESSFAGALGVKLGGVDIYDGLEVRKPELGEAVRQVYRQDILSSVQLMIASAWVTLAGSLLLSIFLGRLLM